MKKIIPLILGLVLGVGAGTGLYVMRGGGTPDEAAQTAEDDQAHDDPVDSSHVAMSGGEGSEPDSAEHGPGPDAPPESASDTTDPATQAIAAALLAQNDTSGEARADTGIVAGQLGQGETEPAGEDIPDAGTEEQQAADPTPTTGAAEDAGAALAGSFPAEANSSTDLIGGPVDNEEAAKRVAKIFSQMQARDAARVLTLMERSEVELILKQLDNRSAAKILSGLSPEQAAVLSAVLIRGGI